MGPAGGTGIDPGVSAPDQRGCLAIDVLIAAGRAVCPGVLGRRAGGRRGTGAGRRGDLRHPRAAQAAGGTGCRADEAERRRLALLGDALAGEGPGAALGVLLPATLSGAGT